MSLTRVCLFVALSTMGAVAACYSSSDASPAPTTTSPDGGGSGDSDAGTTTTTPDQTAFALGEALVQTYACTSCHGSDLSGNIEQDSGVYSANITPDMDTGIGSWTLANLTSALRDSLDDQGQPICSAMPKFPSLSDDDIVDIYAYLQGIPAVSKAQTDTDCNGNPDGDDDDDDGGADSGGDDGGADGGADSGVDAAADSGPDASDPCPHKVCTEGAALSPSCGGCAAAVCSHDPSCCVTAWSESCVSEVNGLCVTQCN